MNTFGAFDISGSPDPEPIADLFADFYITQATGATNPLGTYINASIQRTNGLLVEMVEDPETPPNAVAFAKQYTLPAAGQSSSWPQEVALCLTTINEADYAAHPRRSRGRVYLGPLIAGVNQTVSGVSRPLPGIIDDMCAAATELKDAMVVGSAPVTRAWAIWSRADGLFKPVNGGWVDDEWDTQRRRGHSRTGRQLWS